MVSPCGKVSIPIASAAYDQPGALNQNDEFIRDYHGEGIQHIAFLSSNIEQTIEAMETAGIDFMGARPRGYYENLSAQVAGHGQNLDSIERRGILVDGKGNGRILLQRFTRRQIGPIFLEIIERRGEDGFGEGGWARSCKRLDSASQISSSWSAITSMSTSSLRHFSRSRIATSRQMPPPGPSAPKSSEHQAKYLVQQIFKGHQGQK
jgi:4-hydroxyphenylpyruvate dioxygenase-like putative hemolysin